jgi:uracil-DNA glycosylase
MLNTCLTVRASKAGSHSNKGWEDFTDKVVDIVDKYGGANLGAENLGFGRGVVFLAWGAWAAKRVAKLNKVSCPFGIVIKMRADAPLSTQHRRNILY